jgi:hypothetical protein
VLIFGAGVWAADGQPACWIRIPLAAKVYPPDRTHCALHTLNMHCLPPPPPLLCTAEDSDDVSLVNSEDVLDEDD